MDRYTGTILKDRFVLEDIVGSGGMAIVYRATDRVTGNTVAVKILKEEFVSDEQFRRRFLNESRAISMLRHRNIVSVIDFDFEGNLQYIVMEYVDGITLKDFIRSQKIIPAGIAIKITMQILSALQHAHERGVIHRDIKPQNIMILNDGTIKVMDFGIARINKFETVTMTDKAIGTVYYISPEQARGEHTDERSDVYSIGVMLYEMLTGEMPFDGDTPVNVAIKQIQTAAKRPRSINRTIPVGLEQIVMRAMMKTPDKRYASAIDMVADLKKVLTDDSVEFDYDLDEELPTGDMVPVADEPKEKFWTKNNIIALCSGIAAGLVVIALIVVLFFVGGGSGTTAPSSSTMALEVPNFVGKLYAEVKDDQMLGDITVTAQEEYNADYDKGYIFEQSIVAGTEVQTGTEIIVKVSLGSKTITVPNIIDSEVESAIAALDKLGIDYQIIKQQSDDVKENYVIRTQPAADAEISEGKTLFVYVSTGSDAVMVEVPDLLGKDKNTAIMMLSAANLTYQIIDEEYSDSYKAGTVITQSKAKGTEVPEGTEILLILSKGPNPSASSSSSSSETD
jgi:serine/threonine-protein kinase